MNRRIVSDSSSNVLELEGVDFRSVPLKILIEGKEYVDNKDLDVPEMVAELIATKKPNSSSCPNPFDYEEAYEGADEVFVVTITSGLSGSWNSAETAAKYYMEKNEGKKVCVIDSLSAGPELQLIIEKLAELFKEDLTFEEIVEQIHEYQKHSHLVFTLESLANLAKNGRVNPAVAKIAGLLGIRFIGIASEEGKLQQISNVKGMKRAVAGTLDAMKKYGFNGRKVRIAHCLNPEAAYRLKDLIAAEFPFADVIVEATTGLCSYYAEKGGLMIGFEDGQAAD
ncbi:MAG: DegV family protein [Solobacterium sp.]|nr:DegV family protein [Solobacterium sp.]